MKHFAAAAVALTALLALFASGEDWGAQAQVNAVEAKNQLVAAEAEKLGTKKLAGKLNVSNDLGAATFGNDVGVGGDFNSGGGYGATRAPSSQPQRRMLNPPLQQQPDQASEPIAPTGNNGPSGDPKKRAARTEPFEPSAEQIEQAKAASLARAGGGTGTD